MVQLAKQLLSLYTWRLKIESMRILSQICTIKHVFFLPLCLSLICCGPETQKAFIISATYGNIANAAANKNVLEIVEKNLFYTTNGEAILNMDRFYSFNEIFGDPAPGATKHFKLEYYYPNQNRNVTISIAEFDFNCNKLLLLKPSRKN